MALFEFFYSFAGFRKALWKHWYPFLTRRLRGEPVLFLNYAFEESPPMNIPLAPEDAPNRACIQLYHHVATQTDLKGKDVLEVSCGHGGGASYVARALGPAHYTGLDLNPAGIRSCRERHRIAGLDFIQGDAERLPFPDRSFDAVINVEASHCYPSFPRFLSETARVLKPGGHFLYADFRFKDELADWDAAFAAAPLRPAGSRDISVQVLRGMELNSNRSLDLIVRFLPTFLHRLGRDFAGIKGSRIHKALVNKDLIYRSYHLQSDK